MSDLMAVCKAGAAGCCSVLLIVFGVFICFPGVALLAVGSAEADDFYEETNRHLQIIGGVMLCVGLIMIVVAIGLCCYVCRKMSAGTPRQGVVLSTNPSQTTATVTTAYSTVPSNPPGAYPSQHQQPYPPQQQQPYPPQQQQPNPLHQHHQYPPQHQHHQYPPQQQKYSAAPPPQQHPPQQYQSMQQAPAPPQYGAQQYGPPPPLNPAYAASAQPTAPYPTLDKNSAAPSAPPRNQMSFKR